MRAMIPDRARPILVVADDPKIVVQVRSELERQRRRVVEAFDGSAMSASDPPEPALIVRLDAVTATNVREARRRTNDVDGGRLRETRRRIRRHPRRSMRSGARRSDVSFVRPGGSAADGPR